MKARILALRFLTQRKVPRCMGLGSIILNQTEIRFREAEVGVKCTCRHQALPRPRGNTSGFESLAVTGLTMVGRPNHR
jgi:hypothetical protein